ncbi:unnamed protein product, partial [Owenia fusiformis]
MKAVLVLIWVWIVVVNQLDAVSSVYQTRYEQLGPGCKRLCISTKYFNLTCPSGQIINITDAIIGSRLIHPLLECTNATIRCISANLSRIAYIKQQCDNKLNCSFAPNISGSCIPRIGLPFGNNFEQVCFECYGIRSTSLTTSEIGTRYSSTTGHVATKPRTTLSSK